MCGNQQTIPAYRQPRIYSVLCVLCPEIEMKTAKVEINDVLLCFEHGRIAAMKRLGLTEDDLKPSVTAEQEVR